MPSLSSSPWIRGAPHRLITDQVADFPGTAGRPPLDRDFQRQNALKPRRCQRISVSGLKIATASTTAGQAIEPDEQQPIRIGQPHTHWRPPTQNIQLMAENEVPSLSRRRDFTSDTSQSSSSLTIPTCGGMMTRFGTSQIIPGRVEFSVATGSEAIQPNQHQSVEGPENRSLRGIAPQHIDLLPENQDFRLKPRP